MCVCCVCVREKETESLAGASVAIDEDLGGDHSAERRKNGGQVPIGKV